jgi:hypothetical protein
MTALDILLTELRRAIPNLTQADAAGVATRLAIALRDSGILCAERSADRPEWNLIDWRATREHCSRDSRPA